MEAATISFPTPADEGVYYLWSLDYAHLSAFGQVYKNKSAHQSFPPEFPVYGFTPAPLPYLLDGSLNPQMGLNWEGKQKQNLEAWKPTDNPVILLILLKKKKERSLALDHLQFASHYQQCLICTECCLDSNTSAHTNIKDTRYMFKFIKIYWERKYIQCNKERNSPLWNTK